MARDYKMNRIKAFFQGIWQECRDWRTLVILLIVAVVMYLPVWGGYLMYAVFGWKWCSAVSTAVLLFWAAPFTPFFPLCMGITLFIKKALKLKDKKGISKKMEVGIAAENNLYDEKPITYDKMFWLFMSGSVAGVIVEGVFCLITKEHWESHVVSVFGAFNILYGFGAVLFYAGAVKLKDRPVAVRVITMALTATLLELLCRLFLKYGLGMRAWNYENSFLNYKGMICVGFSLIWGIAAFSFCKLYPYVDKMLSRLRGRKMRVACGILSVLMVFNLCFTGASILRWSERHYGIAASCNVQKYLDYDTPDNWMQSRFVEWEFLDEQQ